MRSARFVRICHVTSVRRSSTSENSRFKRSSGTHSPKMSVMSPMKQRDPATSRPPIRFAVRILRSSASSRNGVSPFMVWTVNGPPRPYRFASASL